MDNGEAAKALNDFEAEGAANTPPLLQAGGTNGRRDPIFCLPAGRA